MNNRYVTLQAAGKLKITDKGILSSLLRLASDDNSWKVKAHTIKGEHYRAIKPRTAIFCSLQLQHVNYHSTNWCAG